MDSLGGKNKEQKMKNQVLGKVALEMLSLTPILLPDGLWYSTGFPADGFFTNEQIGWLKVYLFDKNADKINESEEEVSPTFFRTIEGDYRYGGLRIRENGDSTFYPAQTIPNPISLEASIVTLKALILMAKSIVTINNDSFVYCNITDSEKWPKYLLYQINVDGMTTNPHILKICGSDAYLFPISQPDFCKRQIKTSELEFSGPDCEEINLKTPYDCELIMGEPEPPED